MKFMKKIKYYLSIIILLFIFLLAGCNVKDDGNNENENGKDEQIDDILYSEELPYIGEVIGSGYIVYDNDDENPYGVDLDKFGSDIRAVFYDPDFDSISDPYTNLNKNDFYLNYKDADSYEDSIYRTNHFLVSGDITPQTHIPNNKAIYENEIAVRCTTATYLLSYEGDYLGYFINTDSDYRIIYYGAGYTSLNDVAAYLLAFGEVPANSKYDKSKGRNQSVLDWGEYGRCNYGVFSGDTSKYPYEPLLPSIKTARFRETDFGTLGEYENYNSITGTRYIQKIYNDGNAISRGAARFVFTDSTSVSSIDDRYVFYTYNHYNDFEEYLNYDNGWGIRFGNESAGNEYCSSNKDYNQSNKYPITLYMQTCLRKLEEIFK